MLTYSTGGWHAVATPTSVALLAPDVPVTVLPMIWESMSEGDGLAAVLGGLVGTFGMQIPAFPPFAIASYDEAAGAVRVIVRGAVQVRVATEDEPVVHVSGLGVTSWTERVISHPTLVELGVLEDSADVLPLRDGVVAAGALRWALVAAAAGAAVVHETIEPQPVTAVIPLPLTTAVPAPPPPAPVASVTPEPAPAEAFVESAETIIPDVAETRTEAHEDELLDATTGYDDLIFGETRISTVEDAAVRAPTGEVGAVPPASAPTGLIDGIPAAAVAAPAPVETLGDHDGETISAEQLAALLAGAPDASSPSAPVSSRQVPTLIVSNGDRYTLDRSAVVGLRPRAVRATGAVPHLVVVASDSGHISRSHVEIRVEGADLLAVDLNATNGTRLLRLGADPVRLHPGESTLLVSGDRLDLGDGVVLSFEGI